MIFVASMTSKRAGSISSKPGRTSFSSAPSEKRAPLTIIVTQRPSPPWSSFTSVIWNGIRSAVMCTGMFARGPDSARTST